VFARNRDGFNVALVRLEDWAQAGVEANVERLARTLRSEILVITRADSFTRRLREVRSRLFVKGRPHGSTGLRRAKTEP